MSLRNVGAAEQQGPAYPESHQGHDVGIGETPGLGRIASQSLAMTSIARSDERLCSPRSYSVALLWTRSRCSEGKGSEEERGHDVEEGESHEAERFPLLGARL